MLLQEDGKMFVVSIARNIFVGVGVGGRVGVF